MTDHELLQDKPHRHVVRVGDTVRRPLQPWSSSVHELLLHLEQIGFPYAPRFKGIDDEGREVVTFLDGESGPAGWAKVVDERGLVNMARLLREYHDAVRGFHPTAEAGWAGFEGDGEIVLHGDFGPWNLVWHGVQPVGILDWDYAWPGRPVHDVAYALEYVAPFRDDAMCRQWLAYPEPPDRRRRLEVFATAYGIGAEGLVDEVIAQQVAVQERTRRLAEQGLQPQAEWLATGFLDTTADRIRWSRENRHRLE
ncbi:phosphotransferase [Paractinoplanes abujensis]|uniref:Aminoglycoside phosphotransferase (APT) family kinase protein n=1 Tax=Paractinoplanes abujensis TaxID=882441 RepID=A0A7W7CM61_9ACTN|nr:aminoglycoside phosphotransferase family protein [Actinoplanes abujensis]MBB4691063.1 aminoglycoside phosphotransferase (APT) family kinase protein [Actinoplanes abujensis]GID17525.1 phosphotransferase [Actinoplanes abujensis]